MLHPVEAMEKQTILTIKELLTFGPVGSILWKMRILFELKTFHFMDVYLAVSVLYDSVCCCVHPCWIHHHPICTHVKASHMCMCAKVFAQHPKGVGSFYESEYPWPLSPTA